MKPGGKVSIVWKFFGKNNDGKTVMCNICKRNFKYFGNTTNLKQHLERIHPAKLRDETGLVVLEPDHSVSAHLNEEAPSSSAGIPFSATIQSKRSAQDSTVVSKKPTKQMRLYGVKEKEFTQNEKEQVDKCLLKMVASDYQPLSIVENAGFLEYSFNLQPLYKPPSRKTLSTQLIPKMYDEVKEKIKTMLSALEFVAVTTDMWSSDSNKSYYTVTCHFNYNNKLYSPVLATREMRDSHTGQNIASVLSSVFLEWNIDKKNCDNSIG